jgi:hypothetical protein
VGGAHRRLWTSPPWSRPHSTAPSATIRTRARAWRVRRHHTAVDGDDCAPIRHRHDGRAVGHLVNTLLGDQATRRWDERAIGRSRAAAEEQSKHQGQDTHGPKLAPGDRVRPWAGKTSPAIKDAAGTHLCCDCRSGCRAHGLHGPRTEKFLDRTRLTSRCELNTFPPSGPASGPAAPGHTGHSTSAEARQTRRESATALGCEGARLARCPDCSDCPKPLGSRACARRGQRTQCSSCGSGSHSSAVRRRLLRRKRRQTGASQKPGDLTRAPTFATRASHRRRSAEQRPRRS